MTTDKIEKLLELISEIVREDGPYKNKRDAVLAKASNVDIVNLEEFAT